MQGNQKKIGLLLSCACEVMKVAITLLYTPIMLRLLGQSEYGLYQMVGSVVSSLSLLSFGFGSAYVRYYSQYQVKEDREGIARLNGMFMMIFCAMSALCLICGGVMVANARLVFGNGLTASEMATAKILLVILVVNMALTFPNSVFDSHVTAHERFLFQKLLRIAQYLFNPFLTLPLLLMGYGSVAVVGVTTVLTVAVFLVNIFYCARKLNITFCFRGLQFSLLKEMWIFTFFIFLEQIIDQINWSVDKFLLGRLSGTGETAVYGIGGQINSLYVQMAVAVTVVFIPQTNRLVAGSNDNAALTRLMTKVGRVKFILLALIFTGFAFFGRPFLRLWAGEGYERSYEVALVLMLSMLAPLIQNLGFEIQRAKNMHSVRSVVYACLAVANVVISIFLIKRWGCVGAALGTAIVQFVGTFAFANWYYHKKVGLDMGYFWKEICKFIPSLGLVCLFGAVYGYFFEISGWTTLVLSVAVYAGVFAVVFWCLGLNDYEKRLVKKMLGKVPGLGRGGA
jgi:O-antigen/teichoic acid export membrane protein